MMSSGTRGIRDEHTEETDDDDDDAWEDSTRLSNVAVSND
jgi:hypothetical protein